jgi:hypothetical protein
MLCKYNYLMHVHEVVKCWNLGTKISAAEMAFNSAEYKRVAANFR